jgi:hypothetical protein
MTLPLSSFSGGKVVVFCKLLFLLIWVFTSNATHTKHDTSRGNKNTFNQQYVGDNADRPSFLVDVSPSICKSTSPFPDRIPRGKLQVFPHKPKGDTHESMLLDEKRRIIIDWTPKAACTKVVEMFWNEMNITRGIHYPENAFVHNYRPGFYLRCGTISQDMLDSPNYYKFKVVRNPFNRAVSSYLHIMKNALEMLQEEEDKSRKGRQSENSTMANLSFEDFLSFYIERVQPRSSNVRNSAQIHFRPQSSKDEVQRFKNIKQKAIFNRIVHLEKFEEEISLVNKDTNMNYSFPEGFDGHVIKKFAQTDDYRGNWTFSDLMKNEGIPENYGKFYNRKTKKMVADIFLNDLKVYNYSFPFDRLY